MAGNRGNTANGHWTKVQSGYIMVCSGSVPSKCPHVKCNLGEKPDVHQCVKRFKCYPSTILYASIYLSSHFYIEEVRILAYKSD